MPHTSRYGGYNDRIAIVPRELARDFFNITESIVKDWRYYYQLSGDRLNFEKIVKYHLSKAKLKVKFFCLNAFTVSRPSDKSLFKMSGTPHPKLAKLKLLAKYPKEMQDAAACHPQGDRGMWQDILNSSSRGSKLWMDVPTSSCQVQQNIQHRC